MLDTFVNLYVGSFEIFDPDLVIRVSVSSKSYLNVEKSK